jgi:hypothetical protein
VTGAEDVVMREHAWSNRKLMYAVLGLAVLLVLWYLFRPERLFINKTVNEPPPHSSLSPPAVLMVAER